MKESELQKQVVDYARKRYHALCHGTANGATGGKRFGVGALIGIPDLLILEPRGGYGGLMIELKTEAGKLEPVQESVCGELAKIGYYVEVCHGMESAIKCIDEYFKLEPWTPIIGQARHFIIRHGRKQ